MNHILARIGGYRFAGSSGCQVPRRFLLPAFVLAANLGDFDAAVAFMDGTERGARFDRLELLWIADQHDLGAGVRGVRHDALHLALADHPRLVNDEDIELGRASSRERVGPYVSISVVAL